MTPLGCHASVTQNGDELNTIPRMKEPKGWASFNAYIKSLSGAPSAPEDESEIPGPFINRDLSWLEFNDRVLSEAADESVPPLERLRFAAITSSNLDEFFMVRIAELARRNKSGDHQPDPSGYTPAKLLPLIRNHVLRQKSDQAAILREILSVLAKEGILIYADFKDDPDLDKEIRSSLPQINYVIRRDDAPFVNLMSERLHVFVRFPGEYAIITIEDRAARLLKLSSTGKTLRYALIERWLSARAQDFFPNRELMEAFPFKIIRDADLRYHPDDEESLEEQIRDAVEERRKARVVRLEVDAPHYSEGALYLATALGLDSAALYRFSLPLDLRTLATIYNQGPDRLKYKPIEPRIPPLLRNNKNIFESITKRDILLHHPYDSFETVTDFLKAAAADKNVTHIYHTMYRTSKESPVMEALKQAVHNGKKVTAYVEIKARFDELNNVRWAEELRKSGVKVVRPLGGYKVHSKLTEVVRKENGQDVYYAHLGTGNYHPGTALQYTDLGLLTNDQSVTREALTYFRTMMNRQEHARFHHLMTAPVNLHSGFIKLIEEETRYQKQGGKGHIIAKMNSLVDPDIIRALYHASQAGVKIELLVRGICCLRPGVKHLSDNIRVTSIVDRFLEHSRIYYFRSGGMKRMYLSSADWMPRNFYTRFEVAFPINDTHLKTFIRETILETSLSDNTKAWALKSNGRYERVEAGVHQPVVRSQFAFENLAKADYRGTVLEGRPRSTRTR